MIVKAKQGTKCPMEGKPRQYITDSTPVDVQNTAYYLRLIKDGSLVPVCKPAGMQTGRLKTKGGAKKS